MVLLHPIMREAAQKVLAACQAANLPFRIFEAWRSPERQQYLYAQGRTRAGAIVTYAQAWQSYHQYGLAADFVLYRNGQWSWDDSGANEALWDQLHAIGKSFGLEPLGFETPHLQVAGLKSANLLEGILPDGGDGSWKTNLAGAVDRWTGLPAGPPPFENNQVRPALSTGAIDSSKAPAMDSSDWHSLFGGQEWRYDAGGVYLRANPGAPCRSAGAPATAQSIIGIYGAEIFEASIAHNVPPELIVMTIATETGAQRNAKYTGPLTFRWEPAVRVNDVTPPAFGDYSAGPMQTLATSAREVIRNLNLSKYQPMQTAPYIAVKPDPAPPANPLYDGATNIDIGTAEIRSRINKSKIDPILVAACFNAGGLYQSDQTVWRIRSYGDHLDRASQWFGDACFVLSTLRAKA
jgi:peptidoglycan L-alanyl-D-glutamate endopeptidase CwlK